MTDGNDMIGDSGDASALRITELQKQLEDAELIIQETSRELTEAKDELASALEAEKQLHALIGPDGEHVASWRATLANDLALVITGLIVLAVAIFRTRNQVYFSQ